MEPVDLMFQAANAVKASFDEIYDLPDPRRYYQTLGALDYRIPSEAREVFIAVINAIGAGELSVIDVGCSYGVNAAMIKYDLEFSDLVARYRDRVLQGASVAEAIFDDAAYFADLSMTQNARFTGVDVAGEAAGYAKAVGLIDAAITNDLESTALSPEAAAAVADADLIISTGAVGYVTEQTFSKLVAAVRGDPPFVAAFSLRQFPFDQIAQSLERFGLETEKLEGRYFPQRRFSDAEEMEGALAAIETQGLDPTGLEADGRYFAEFYYAAPRSGPRLSDLRL